ncbi:MAG: YqhA family protein [Anaerolineales bacterium]
MNRILESSKYLSLIAVISLFFSALAAFFWGATKTYVTIMLIVSTGGKDPFITVSLVEIMDAFLIATGLLLFSVSLYELMIGHLNLPDWMLARTLHDLKTKLSSIIVLVIVVKFVEKLVDTKDYQGIFYYALAVGVVSATLIAFSHFGKKD